MVVHHHHHPRVPSSSCSTQTHIGQVSTSFQLNPTESFVYDSLALERESTDRKIRGSNPTSPSQLLLSRLRQPGNIPALLLPSGGMVARYQKGVTAERIIARLDSSESLVYDVLQLTALHAGRLMFQLVRYSRYRCVLS
ncbi:hypothetical protein CSKR_112574 [Clonorchis sinensis]|uniref:Uncharacterized protein n=1 Tax=Clonorchis sinensis TaxID=79923 RepID=A0A3R7GQ69_CLOSI|nr:hypothetical protein CSKR_112574 [Clonorchis sinensis]